MLHTPRRIDMRPTFCCDLEVQDLQGSPDPLFNTEVSEVICRLWRIRILSFLLYDNFTRSSVITVPHRVLQVIANLSCTPSREAEPFHDLTPIFERIGAAVPAARWQFFISQRTHIEYPAQSGSFCGDVTRHRFVYKYPMYSLNT